MYFVNELGLKEISDFLQANHKSHESFYGNSDCLKAWAKQAEFQIGEGNDAEIEINSWNSVSGRTEKYKISNEGLTFERVTK